MSAHAKDCMCDTCFYARQEAVLKASHLDDHEDDRGCPCLLADIPCHSQCTCVRSGMSVGCRRCARYGSLEQRKGMSDHLAKILDRHYAYVNALYELDVHEIVKWVDTRLAQGRLDEVANALIDMHPRGIEPNEIVGWLSATCAVKDQLGGSRTQFVESVRPELVRAFGEDRVAKIWARLG
jgi:hypothetical protein